MKQIVVRTVLRIGYRNCKSGERGLRNEEKDKGFHDQLGFSARNIWEGGRKSGRAMPGKRMLYRDFIREANGSSLKSTKL